MDDNKRAYLSMAEKVDAYLLLKATEIAATPAAGVGALQVILHGQIDTALDHDTTANLNNTGQAITKNDERDEVMTSTRRVIPYLVKYFLGLTVPDKRMAERIGFEKSALEKMDDNFFYDNAKLVYDTAHVSTTLTAIIALGYTNALHTAHNANLGQFRLLINTPRMLVGDTSSYTRQVVRDLDAIRDTLDLMDLDINLIEFDFPLLFDGYYACRKIDDASSGGGGVSSGTVNAGEKKQVRTFTYDSGINIKFENTGTDTLDFFLMLGGAEVGTPVTVDGGDTQNHPITDLHSNGDALFVGNSALSSGSYKITFS